MFICAKGEEFNFAKSIGVGLVDTALLLSKYILEESPKKLIFVGSAGSYDYNIDICSIYFSSISTQIESSLFICNSYTPIINEIKNVSYETLINKSIENMAIVNSSNYITTDNKIANLMLKKDILLENMEFFSVLKAAEYYGIHAFGIFCVTNYCNNNAHKDFLSNHKRAIQVLQNYINNNLL